MNRVSSQPLRIAAIAALMFAFITATSAQTKAPAAGKSAPAKTADAADPDVALAKKAALEWLALVDAGKFEGSWDEAATSLQKGQKKTDWSTGLGGSRATMGKVVTRTFLNSEIRTALPNLPPDKYITVRFTTAFEKHKDGAESVTLVKDGTRGLRTMSYFLK
ncbi:MAG: DUF4019 domain-containing protein [Vicinamibacteria bacterium]